ncbi:MAG: polyprenyl diphosphate synthase, partial [Spirochaetia bacterium]
KAVRKEIAAVTADTRTYNGIAVNIAVNYGGRNEIIRAFNRYIKDNLDKPLTTEDVLREYLDLPDFPDPDLIIRSGGHRRISNFLLWQSAYSELYFSDKLWPDWEGSDLIAAISDFKARKRNYGGTK